MWKTVVSLFLIFHVGCFADKLNVQVLFESLCPDSLQFISTQLHPAWNDIAPYVNINLVPFGKSSSLDKGSDFVCQHGPQECKGNRMMSCAIDNLSDQSKQVEYVTCFMENYRKSKTEPEEVGRLCAGNVNLEFNLVKTCYNAPRGTELQLGAEEQTAKFTPSFIPTIVYNGEFRQDLQDISLRKFRELVCQLLKSDFPNSCQKK